MMIYKNLSLAIIITFCVTALCIAQPNLKWISPDITITPLNPEAGDTVTFKATFQCAREDVKDLLVIVKVDGSSIWSNTYPDLYKSQQVEVSVNWQAVAGNHTVSMEIDPNNTIIENYENDNNLSKQFSVAASCAADARWKGDIKFTPQVPIVGNPVTASATIEVVGAGTLKNLRIVGGIKSQGQKLDDYLTIPAGTQRTVSFGWTPLEIGGPEEVKFIIDPQNKVCETNDNNNKIEKITGIAGTKPDLVVFLGHSPSKPVFGDVITIKARVRNVGYIPSGPCKLDILIGGETNPKRFNIPGLQQGEKHDYLVTRTFDTTLPGDEIPPAMLLGYNAKIDVLNEVAEMNEGNNISKKELTIIDKRPELVFTSFKIPDRTRTIGAKCRVRGQVKNTGKGDAPPFFIEIYWDTCPGIAEGTHGTTVNGLRAGEVYAFEFTHRYACFKMQYGWVKIDSKNQVQEKNEDNNKKEFSFHISGENI